MSPRMHGDHHPAPTLAELQHRVDGWIRQFEEGYWPPLSMLARLTEEVGELARELNHSFGHKPKKKEEPPGEIALEVADIIFVLVCLCNSLGIDLGDAFERVMHKYEVRDQTRWTPRSGRHRTRKVATGEKPRRRSATAKAAERPRRTRKRTAPRSR